MKVDAVKIDTGSLERELRRHPSWLIAYSGGVDSAFLLWFASRLGDIRVSGAIADSPSLKRGELAAALEFARRHGLPLRVVRTEELEKEDYRSNPPNRCYFCKFELFSEMTRLAGEMGVAALAYGENADDPADERPGRLAAQRFAVSAPLRDAGLGKAQIRALAAAAGLEVADKAAQPCLASRIPHGHEVTGKKMRQVEQAEELFSQRGFRIVRVRHLGDKALVQVGPDEMLRCSDEAMRVELEEALKKLGFREVAWDPAGYSGAALY